MTDPWQDPKAYEKLARQLGQNDPYEQKTGKHRDNDNADPAKRADLPRAVLFGGALVVVGVLAAFVLLWLWG